MLGKNKLMSKLESYQRKNKRFEELKGMDAATFDQLFNNGDLGDDKEWIEWDHVVSVIRVLKSKLRELDDITYEHGLSQTTSTVVTRSERAKERT